MEQIWNKFIPDLQFKPLYESYKYQVFLVESKVTGRHGLLTGMVARCDFRQPES